MVSPVPKHLTTDADHAGIPPAFRDHVINLAVDPARGAKAKGTGAHRAKYAPGLASALLDLAGTRSVGDPMAGTGTIARETGVAAALNDLDAGMAKFLDPLRDAGCEVTYGPAHEVRWSREVCIFSPPYYPKADRRRPCAHNDAKRGPVVGFRDSYSADHPAFIGNPGGVNAIAIYRAQMRRVYSHMLSVCGRMIVVTKNWTRLGVEMRLDLDTILMAQAAGWEVEARHGWVPPQSLWNRFNEKRGGGVQIEDVTVFRRAAA
jgi:hypothetical protein